MPVRLGLRLPVFSLVASISIVVGCEPAQPYRGTGVDTATKPPLSITYGWANEPLPPDIPIVFVDAVSRPEEWQKLKDDWNRLPGVAGPRTLHLGQTPLGAAALIRLSAELDVVKIKVPLGLPDPTPYIPAANPPTLAKWELGKKLFFDKNWLYRSEQKACADCHKPADGFVARRDTSDRRYDTLSLINVVYNKHQFWDGRAELLEQSLARQLDDERALGELAERHHVWPGVVGSLRGNTKYFEEFKRVFGAAAAPTQDNLGKALATYMRTILSGNSIYDQAEQVRRQMQAKTLEPEHFEKVLTPKALKALATSQSEAATGRELHRGYQLFHGKARCAQCHPAPLFTNHDFHNLGIRKDVDEFTFATVGAETGRFKHLPIGLKDRRLIGAYRTPTLRALPRTNPYFNDGSRDNLQKVIKFYNEELNADTNNFLDPLLLGAPGTAIRLGLDEPEIRALELFLRSLDGDEIPTVISGVETKK